MIPFTAKVSLKFPLTQIWAEDTYKKGFVKFSSASLFLKTSFSPPPHFWVVLWLPGQSAAGPKGS